MKTSVTMRKYTVRLGLPHIVMFVDLILMYGWYEDGVSHANKNCTSDFATMRLHIFYAYKTYFGCLDTKIKPGVDMRPNLLIKCRNFYFYEIY
jgi:NhaP-type Na+/H+ and K+/H+ antiporter